MSFVLPHLSSVSFTAQGLLIGTDIKIAIILELPWRRGEQKNAGSPRGLTCGREGDAGADGQGDLGGQPALGWTGDGRSLPPLFSFPREGIL